MTKNQNKVNCEKNLIEASVRLITKNVPLLVVFQHKGVLMHYGTKEMCGWFNDIGESMKDDLKNRMIADMVQLVDGSQKIVLDGFLGRASGEFSNKIAKGKNLLTKILNSIFPHITL